jgi:DMSO/TMAO reductase YedYZ molybdopterin-dependent catalytic subunit
MPPVSRGFFGRNREPADPTRVPPGQHLVKDWPVLTYGPTPHTKTEDWTFSIDGVVDSAQRWTWNEMMALPQETITKDIHCVTSWSKLDTTWTGVSVDVLLEASGFTGKWISAWCDGGYTTNLPIADVTGGKAWIAHTYGGEPLAREHGGPARLLVPHLYFWKSAKWVRGITVTAVDEPGFWEQNGYHDHGDPWTEERYGVNFR